MQLLYPHSRLLAAGRYCPKTRLMIWESHVVATNDKPLLINNVQVFNAMISEGIGSVYQGSFLLAEEAKTGTYTIRVTGRNPASCTFSVEEYVLPKFGVEIEG